MKRKKKKKTKTTFGRRYNYYLLLNRDIVKENKGK